MFKQLFCNHDYEKIDQQTIKSEFELVKEMGFRPTTWHSMKRKYIHFYNCKKCNKLKKIVLKPNRF